ncbi:MAG: hypothetical protein AAFO69_00330, partial [Bacteroidota bacterium]
MIRYIVFIFLTICAAGTAVAQNYQAEYLEAKRLYNNKEYRSAKDAFGALSASSAKHSFGEYASFFYGLSAYHQGNFKEAKDMWLQLLSRKSNWVQKDHVNWWLAAANFKTGDFDRATKYLGAIRDNTLSQTGKNLKLDYFQTVDDLPSLISLYDRHSADKDLAMFLLDRLYLSDSLAHYSEQAKELIKQLDKDEEIYFPRNYQSVKKDTYKVAVLFPFNYDSVESASAVAKNRTVMDLYEGILLAVEKLADEGKKIALYPYDTKGNRPGLAAIEEILAREEMLGMDLIIGPLYPRPFQKVFEFSKRHRINMINPISESDRVMGDNPFSFLYKSGNTVVANQLADYAFRTFENRTAFVFYEERDSLLAVAYKTKLEANDFQIPVFEKLNFENYREQSDILTATDDILITSSYQEDSLEQFNYVTFDERRKKGEMVTYAEVLKVVPDSVGHILVCSQSNLAASNFISAVIQRPDTIPLIGKRQWLDISLVTYDQMEDIGLSIIAPGFVPQNTEVFEETRRQFIRRLKTMPSDFHFTGYELMLTMGNVMHKYGNYIQEGFRKEEVVPGTLTRGFKYG